MLTTSARIAIGANAGTATKRADNVLATAETKLAAERRRLSALEAEAADFRAELDAVQGAEYSSSRRLG